MKLGTGGDAEGRLADRPTDQEVQAEPGEVRALLPRQRGGRPGAGVVLCWTLVLAAIATVVTVRALDFRTPGRGAENLESSYHVLLTATALAESPASSHAFLPTVTLGRPSDKHLPWGVTLPTRNGDYIYVSFSAVGFLLPYLAIAGGLIPAGLVGLLTLNIGLHIAFVLLLSLLTYRLASAMDWDSEGRLAATVAAAAVGMLTRETLQMFSIVYWSHSISQVLLVLQLWLAFEHHQALGPARSRWLVPLAMVTTLTAMTEWTGFVSAVILACAFALHWRRTRYRPLPVTAMVLLGACAMAGLLLVAHFGLLLDSWEVLRAMASRSAARGVSRDALRPLLVGYAYSFGPLLLLAPLAAWLGWRTTDPARRGLALALLLCAALPLVENFLLLRHASRFAFDRAKGAIPLALAIALGMGALRGRWRLALGLALAFALAINVALYFRVNRFHSWWATIDAGNRALVEQVGPLARADCALVGANRPVRGYLNMLLGRGALEEQSHGQLLARAREVGACGVVYLELQHVFRDMPRIVRIVVTGPEGERVLP